jgi:prevent-host-death family protein
MKEQYIPAGEFKAKCLNLIDLVQAKRQEVIITKHGKPLAKLVPYQQKHRTLFGAMRGKMIIDGDIVEPLDISWEIDQGE